MATQSTPETVRCIFQPNDESTRLITTTMPIQQPRLRTDEHLIKVHSVAVCAGELLWARDFPETLHPGRFSIPCYDVAGTVVTAPPGSPFAAGDEILAYPASGKTGNAREYTVLRTVEMARKPPGLSRVEAASVPLSALTAVQALFVHGGLARGWKDEAGRRGNAKKRILVTAAAGGVGVLALQLARAAGVGQIVAMAGPGNVEFVKTLGATEVVDYTRQSLGAWAAAGNAKVDLVLDMMGRETLADAWTAVEDGGKLISVYEPPEKRKPEGASKDVMSRFFILDANGEQLQEVADLIEKGEVRPIVDSVWEFDEYEKAFAKVDTGHARGKVVINVA